MSFRRSLVLAGALVGFALPLAAEPAPGWKRFDLPETGSYLWRYVPQGLDLSAPAPVALFFHGSGGSPDKYRPFLSRAADRAGLVLVLPRSSTDLGWGTELDGRIVEEGLRLVRNELAVDPRRVSVAGHSSGGGWAYLLAYTTRSGYSAVFSMAARHHEIGALADPSYAAPIRMYYGSADRNYLEGSYAALKRQWQRLGVPWEEEVLEGYGHNTLPPGAVENGFLFLAGKSHPTGVGGCSPGPTALCLRGGRFRVEVAWRDFQGGAGPGRVVAEAAGASDESGLFWFFSPENWELMVKILDGCAVNGRHWVFAAATTTVEHTLTVTDTRTGESASWTNPPGRSAPAITDTAALGGCP